MSDFLNDENAKNDTDEQNTNEEAINSSEKAEETNDFSAASGVDFSFNARVNQNIPPQYNYIPPEKPFNEIPPQRAEYSFDKGFVPPNSEIPPNPYGYHQQYYQNNSQIYNEAPIAGSYNYQTGDNAYRNAIKKTNRKSSKAVIAIAIIVAILCTGGILTAGIFGIMHYVNNETAGINNIDNSKKSNSAAPSVIKPAKTPEGALTIPQIIQKLKPSVVAVEAENVGSGTGIILTADGYILTNAHVVEGGKKFIIITSDGKQYDSKLKGLDSISDIAVLKVDNVELKPAEFGKSSNVVEGDTVIAMGNPYGLDLANTTTAGIISAIRKNITLGDVTMDLLQTDASINPGNSGGPLANQFGQVIGITSLKIMGNSGYTSEGLGFAIPIDNARPIIDEIIEYGRLKGRPMVGIEGQYLTEEYAQMFNLQAGILIQSTTAGTDASKKLQRFDVITKVNGKAFKSMEEFNSEKNKFKAGDTIELTIFRNNKEMKINLILAENTGR